MKEIALNWYHEQSMEYKNSINWPIIMRGTINKHCIEHLYLTLNPKQ